MDLSGEALINAPRERVWVALNDPATLARCIDGVERIDAVSPTEFAAVMSARIGPVRARFSGKVQLSDIVVPVSYVLTGEGSGGVAGFAKGRAEVALDAAHGGSATQLRYQVSSQVGGKLAQMGSRLIEGVARDYAQTFFERLRAEVEAPEPQAALVADPARIEHDEAAADRLPASAWVMVLLAALAGAAILALA